MREAGAKVPSDSPGLEISSATGIPDLERLFAIQAILQTSGKSANFLGRVDFRRSGAKLKSAAPAPCQNAILIF